MTTQISSAEAVSECFQKPITEEWLKASGWKWHQLERQNEKQWLLWVGGLDGRMFSGCEDIGIQLGASHWENRNGETVGDPGEWSVFFRSDTAGRYHRFIHIRYMRWQHELIELIEAVSGQDWCPDNHWYGSIHTPERAAFLRKEAERLDLKWRHEAPPRSKWQEIEKDDTRGRALPEHMEEHAALMCSKCRSHPASHVIKHHENADRKLCCWCYVNEGNPPETTHEYCRIAAKRRRAREAVGQVPDQV